jgi:hypothetical protein
MTITTAINATEEKPTTALATEALDVMLTGWRFIQTKILLAAIELDLFTPLSAAPATATEVQQQLKLHPRATEEFLDTLAAMGLLVREDGTYRAAPAAARYLATDQPSYLGGFLKMTIQFLEPAFDGLVGTLRTGRAHGQDEEGNVPFADVFADRSVLQFFLPGLDAMNGSVGPELAQTFDWSGYASFVDLGGARGNLAADLVLAHPHLRGGVLDLPPVEEFFDQHMVNRGTAGKVDFHGANFFIDELPQADVYILGQVLHDWSVQQRRVLIDKAYAALPPGGVLLIYDPMHNDGRDRLENLLLSMYLITSSPGGSEYTPTECREWLKVAGFGRTTVTSLPSKVTLVAGYKPGR